VARAAKYIALLALFLAAVSMAVGVVAARQYGNAAFTASALAAAIVWFSGSVALALIAASESPYQRLNAVLLAMLIRMGLPILASLAALLLHTELANAGFAGLVVVHYLAGLVLETWMSLRLVASSNSNAGRSSGTATAS
jgi:hypothetical protein